MGTSTLHSIGYGNRSIEDFINQLQQFGIEYLVDVRSKPYSKFNPDFKKKSLDHNLKQAGIQYVFLGDSLGGMPENPCCYNETGKVDYNRIRIQDFYKNSLLRLITAHHKNVKLAIMCSELNPASCHRSKLIGVDLLEQGINLNHINQHNRLMSQAEVSNQMNKGKGIIDLFGETNLSSRKAYLNA